MSMPFCRCGMVSDEEIGITASDGKLTRRQYGGRRMMKDEAKQRLAIAGDR